MGGAKIQTHRSVRLSARPTVIVCSSRCDEQCEDRHCPGISRDCTLTNEHPFERYTSISGFPSGKFCGSKRDLGNKTFRKKKNNAQKRTKIHFENFTCCVGNAFGTTKRLLSCGSLTDAVPMKRVSFTVLQIVFKRLRQTLNQGWILDELELEWDNGDNVNQIRGNPCFLGEGQVPRFSASRPRVPSPVVPGLQNLPFVPRKPDPTGRPDPSQTESGPLHPWPIPLGSLDPSLPPTYVSWAPGSLPTRSPRSLICIYEAPGISTNKGTEIYYLFPHLRSRNADAARSLQFLPQFGDFESMEGARQIYNGAANTEQFRSQNPKGNPRTHASRRKILFLLSLISSTVQRKWVFWHFASGLTIFVTRWLERTQRTWLLTSDDPVAHENFLSKFTRFS